MPWAGGTGALLDPAAASFLYSVNTKCGVERKSRSRTCPGVLGWRWQRPQTPLEVIAPPGLQESTAAFAWQHRGPQGCAHPCSCQESPSLPFPRATEEFLSVPSSSSPVWALSPTDRPQVCCPGASCAQSHRKTPLTCSQSPIATRAAGSATGSAPQRAAGKCPEQTSDRTVPAESLLINREKQQQAPACSQGISGTACSSCLPDTASWDHTFSSSPLLEGK